MRLRTRASNKIVKWSYQKIKDSSIHIHVVDEEETMELSKPTTTLSLIEEDHDGGITSSLEEPLLLTSSPVLTPDFSQDEEPRNIMHEKLRLAITFVTFIILGSLQGVSVKLVTYPMVCCLKITLFLLLNLVSIIIFFLRLKKTSHYFYSLIFLHH